MSQILLFHDDKNFRGTIKEALEKQNFNVVTVSRRSRFFDVLRRRHVDLILIDTHLTDCSDADFIHDIKHYTNVPIIVVNTTHDKGDCVTWLNSGADDYITNPCATDELVARVSANLRRYRLIKTGHHKREKQTRVQFSNWVLDRKKFEILNENKRAGGLSYNEFQLLDFLIANAGKAVKRQDLCEAIRIDNYVPTPRALDVKIARIRKKIDDNPARPNLIKTVRGVGYMFNQAMIKT